MTVQIKGIELLSLPHWTVFKNQSVKLLHGLFNNTYQTISESRGVANMVVSDKILTDYQR